MMGMMNLRSMAAAACVSTMLVAAPAVAESPRETLVSAAFQASDKDAAVALINKAIQQADAILAGQPGNREALLQRAIAIGYRGKLTSNAADAKMALKGFEALVASDPRDAEAQMAVAGWHLNAISQLGAMVARAALGAKRQAGDEALDKAVALGGNRALFPGMAAIMRIRQDHRNIALALKLAETAAAAPAPTSLDRYVKRAAQLMLPSLRAGDGKTAAALAKRLAPFGRIKV